MSLKSNNSETKYNKFNCQFDYSDNYFIDECINSIIAKYGGKYYYILHDKDINDNGELKHLHYHIVLYLATRVRLSTLRDFCDKLTNLPNNHIEVVKSFNCCVQYLIHKNDLDKYQYDVLSIRSNDTDLGVNYLLNNTDVLTDFDLICIIESCDTLKEVSMKVGSSVFCNKYRFITTIFNDRYHRDLPVSDNDLINF